MLTTSSCLVKTKGLQQVSWLLLLGILFLGGGAFSSVSNTNVLVHAFHHTTTTTTTRYPIKKTPVQLSSYKTTTTTTTITTTRLHETLLDESSSDAKSSLQQKGILVLFTVPLAWGTFEPAVRLVYQIQPDIPPFVFSFLYYLVAAVPLCILALIQITSEPESSTIININNDPSSPIMETGAIVDDSTTEPNHGTTDTTTTTNSTSFAPLSSLLPLRGGLELGTYLFVGNGLQVVGLKTVPADRAAFLLQLTTIFVPLAQAISAKDVLAVPPKTWLACLIALCGVGLMGLDGATRDVIDVSSLSLSLETLSWSSFDFTLGDLLVVLAAVAYTFHCIRLEIFAKTTSAIKLAAAKASTETMWSFLVVMVCVLVLALTGPTEISSSPETAVGAVGGLSNVLETARNSGENILGYFNSIQTDFFPAAVDDSDAAAGVHTMAMTATTGSEEGGAQWLTLAAAISWVGLITVAYTIVAQSFGQSYVVPATANLIYTIQPIFTALFAWIVLGESLGPAGYLGGALIGSAVLLVTQENDDSKQSEDE